MWSNGRQLTGVTHGTDSISYQYDDNGLRTKKTVNNVTTEYYRLNGVLLGQKTGSEYIIYLYDENGSAYGLLLKNGTTEEYYYYIYNAQGDVIGIIDQSGTQVVSYDYDAWGKVLSITGTGAQTIGAINPIRYRGYYYDSETHFYYLQSRYYDPETGRFINADGQITAGSDILGCNLFAYCGNNPINRTDSDGHFWITAIIATAVVAVVAAKIVCTVKEVKRVNKELKNLPNPTKDISDSFRNTLKDNANTVKKTTKNKGIIESGKQFYNKVRNKGEWDLKQLPEYQDTFKFNGLIIQAQDIGNINFGYTGKALGLPDSVLLAGAGVAQIKAGTSNLSYIIASNGDDLRDQMYIMYGIALYNEDN